jgi:hypothetical protein
MRLELWLELEAYLHDSSRHYLHARTVSWSLELCSWSYALMRLVTWSVSWKPGTICMHSFLFVGIILVICKHAGRGDYIVCTMCYCYNCCLLVLFCNLLFVVSLMTSFLFLVKLLIGYPSGLKNPAGCGYG